MPITDDIAAAVAGLTGKRTPVEALKHARQVALDLPPGSQGRAFWLAVVDRLHEAGVRDEEPSNTSTFNPLPFTPGEF